MQRTIAHCLLAFTIGMLVSCVRPNSTPILPEVPGPAADNPSPQSSLEKTTTGFYWPLGKEYKGKKNWKADSCTWSGHKDYQPPNYYHIGVDMVYEDIIDDPVYAIADGKVTRISSGSQSGWQGKNNGKNNVGVIIEHQLVDGAKFIAVYGHIISTVKENDSVTAGQLIGTIGPYDYSVPHLHFGIRPGTSTSGPLGRMECPPPPGPITYTNGFVDPIEWITTKSPSGQTVAIAPTVAPTRTPPAPMPTPTRSVATSTLMPTSTPVPTSIESIVGFWYGEVTGSGESIPSRTEEMTFEIKLVCQTGGPCLNIMPASGHNTFDAPLDDTLHTHGHYCFTPKNGYYLFTACFTPQLDGSLFYEGEGGLYAESGTLQRISVASIAGIWTGSVTASGEGGPSATWEEMVEIKVVCQTGKPCLSFPADVTRQAIPFDSEASRDNYYCFTEYQGKLYLYRGCFSLQTNGTLIYNFEYPLWGGGGTLHKQSDPQATQLPNYAPRIYGFSACLQPCNGANATSIFPQGTTKIYAQWNYSNIPAGVEYVRTWTMNGQEWVSYSCIWPGPQTGTDTVTLTEPKGLHSGTWEMTIIVGGQVLLKEQIQVEGNWTYWDPAGSFNTCYRKR